MSKFIPLSVPNIKGNEIKYVTEALESEWVSTGGAMIEKFEKNIAEYVHSAGAVACQSGTAGLHLALRYLDVTEDDLVIVPTLTFIAAVNPVKYEHAQPVFMDCDDSLCMDPVKLRRYLENECRYEDGKIFDKELNKQVKAIIVVHVFGNMADMESIMEVANEYQLPVVEDATEALGTYYTDGKYKGMYAGTIGDIGVYSFNGNKIMTTGGGGMVVSQDTNILNKIKYLSTQAKDDTVNFIHNEIGFNYRMTNLQAAVGIAQLERLEEFIDTKRNNYWHYKDELDEIDSIKILDFRKDIRTNYWFYSLLLDNPNDKPRVIDGLKECNIQSRPIWGLISDQIPYLNSKAYAIEKARYYFDRVVNIPCSTNLTSEDVSYVMDVIKKLIGDENE